MAGTYTNGMSNAKLDDAVRQQVLLDLMQFPSVEKIVHIIETAQAQLNDPTFLDGTLLEAKKILKTHELVAESEKVERAKEQHEAKVKALVLLMELESEV